MEPRRPPITFAHRGGRAHGPDNSLATFIRALELGATGLETDSWITADGVAVLDHDGRVRSGLRSRPIADVERATLPAHIPTLEDLYASCAGDFELSVDVHDRPTAEAVVKAARAHGDGAPERLWLCHPDWKLLASWRESSTFEGVKLVNSTRLRALKDGPERRAAQLNDAGVDGVNLHYSDWSAGLVALFHRFDRVTLGWDAQHERMIGELARMGVDGIYSDHVDRLTAVLG